MPIFSGFVENVPADSINGRLNVPVAHPKALPVTNREVSRLHHQVIKLSQICFSTTSKQHVLYTRNFYHRSCMSIIS